MLNVISTRAEQCWHWNFNGMGSVKMGCCYYDSDILEYLKQDIQTLNIKFQTLLVNTVWSKPILSLFWDRHGYFDAMVLAYCTPGGLPSLEVVSAVPNNGRKKDGIRFEIFHQQNGTFCLVSVCRS